MDRNYFNNRFDYGTCDGNSRPVFRRVRKLAKDDYWLRHVCQCVCPRRTTLLPMDEFSQNLVFQHFSKICRENSSFIKA